MTTLTAVLFVGGESRRMGADKATRLFEDEPLWARQLRTLRELSPEKILISARARPRWCPLKIETVLDTPPSRGPLSGLRAALARAETSHLLVLAVDLPRMNVAGLRKIIAAAGDGFGAVVKGDFYEPLGAVYPVNVVVQKLVTDYASSPSQALQPLVAKLVKENWLRVLPRDGLDANCFTNANTPDELA